MPADNAELPGDQPITMPKEIVQSDDPGMKQATAHRDQPVQLPMDMAKLGDSNTMHVAESVDGEVHNGEGKISTSDESTGDRVESSSLKASVEEAEEDDADGTSNVAAELDMSAAPKKKKKRSKKGKTLRKITGFEG
jgi:hypothetical protein